MNIFLRVLFALALVACSNQVDHVKSLGTEPFSPDVWREADQLKRGAMVYSFLKDRDLTVLNADDMHRLLGESTGYYEYDEIPAYLVGPDHVQSDHGKGYLLAFPLDRKTGLVEYFVINPKP